MTTDEQKSPLRAAHRDLTRTRIVDAALALMRRGDPDALTIAKVAAGAGMTERTIYRHFESREAVLAAVWARVIEIVSTPEMPRTPEAVIAQPRTAFPAFDAEERLMRTIVSTKEGLDLRLSANEDRKAGMRAAVRAARPGLREPALTRLAAVVQLLDSSIAWLTMKDYWGLDGAEAGRAASEAIATLLAATPEKPTTAKATKEKQP